MLMLPAGIGHRHSTVEPVEESNSWY